MEIQWTRMAGQWPVEASPVLLPPENGAEPRILVLNRGGQLLLWNPDGKPLGPGQDGLVAQLPEGQWTTAPTPIETAADSGFLLASVEGRVLALDRNFHSRWKHSLGAKTVWGRAIPARIQTEAGVGWVFTDLSGKATCLSPEGKVTWSASPGTGPSRAPPKALSLKSGGDSVLVPAGATLFCYDQSGQPRWRRELDKEIVTQPETLQGETGTMIVCGTEAGRLFALSSEGKILWEHATGETFSHSLTILQRRAAPPLILFTGLWGNLHAVDSRGKPVWSHHFRAKVRATPQVLDGDGDQRFEIYVPTFHQHLYQFDETGRLTDDVRLSGILPSAVTPLPDSKTGRTDLLLATTTLLAYRLRVAPPQSPYGKTGAPQNVQVRLQQSAGALPSLLLENPAGALVNLQLAFSATQGGSHLQGWITARSAFEIPFPGSVRAGQWRFHATAKDSAGNLLVELSGPVHVGEPAASAPPRPLQAWPASPFADFDETKLVPDSHGSLSNHTNQALALYLDEAEPAAFILASTRTQATHVRITTTPLKATNNSVFSGSLVLRRVVFTGSVNGEQVPDALPALGDSGLTMLDAQRAAKIWISVDARGAQPGAYTGAIVITPISGDPPKIELPFKVEVLDLRLPATFPLTLCTWDYVPNRWFPSRSKEVLDDMARHGVNVFPRSTIPPARVDPARKLTIDWTPLDAELERLHQRGRILFHLNHPPIEFAAAPSPEQKLAFELEYIRAFRDHLRDHGRDYADYAFYLLDEPGLDYGTNIPVLLDAGQLFRQADPKLVTYTDPVPGLSWKDFERIEPLVDLWAPNMRLVSGWLSGDPRTQRILTKSNIWSYECVSQVKSLSPLRYNRANAWRGKFFGLSGIGFWTHSTTEIDHWLPGKTINDEYALVYPGELPVPSARWEAVRDGLEDVAAITLLEQQIQRHRQAGTRPELVRQAEQRLAIALRDVMELSDETFVESRDFLREGDRTLAHTWTDAQLFGRHRADIARLTSALLTP